MTDNFHSPYQPHNPRPQQSGPMQDGNVYNPYAQPQQYQAAYGYPQQYPSPQGAQPHQNYPGNTYPQGVPEPSQTYQYSPMQAHNAPMQAHGYPYTGQPYQQPNIQQAAPNQSGVYSPNTPQQSYGINPAQYNTPYTSPSPVNNNPYERARMHAATTQPAATQPTTPYTTTGYSPTPTASTHVNGYALEHKPFAWAKPFSFGLVFTGAFLAIIGTFLPFLKNTSGVLSLFDANVGAGVTVILIALLEAAIALVYAMKILKESTMLFKIASLAGVLGAVFLIVFTALNMYGADAARVIDAGGWRGGGGPFIIGGGIAVTLAFVFFTMRAFSAATNEKTRQAELVSEVAGATGNISDAVGYSVAKENVSSQQTYDEWGSLNSSTVRDAHTTTSPSSHSAYQDTSRYAPKENHVPNSTMHSTIPTTSGQLNAPQESTHDATTHESKQENPNL